MEGLLRGGSWGLERKGTRGLPAPMLSTCYPFAPSAKIENQSHRMGNSHYTAGRTETQRGTQGCSGWFRAELEPETAGPSRHATIGVKELGSGFPGGAVVKNPPANAGDTGSSPGPGRSHMPWSN